MQPAPSNEVAPIVALVYGLTPRERDVTQLCMAGRSTKHMAQSLGVAAYTVQDHLKSIFDKTGARTRGELVGQIFLEHYIPAMGAGRSHGRVACSHRRSGTIDRARLTQRGLVREGCGQRSPTPSRTVPRRQVPAGRTLHGDLGTLRPLSSVGAGPRSYETPTAGGQTRSRRPVRHAPSIIGR